jgi:hypothetical protein
MTPLLVVGPLQAYRYWRVEWHEGEPVLGSVYRATRWPTAGPLRATCERPPDHLAAWIRGLLSCSTAPPHPAPTWGCVCGIYALNPSEGEAWQALMPQVEQQGPEPLMHVAGVVQLWGRVIQHEQGYRAEYARPLRLLADPSLVATSQIRHLLAAVAQQYGIPLVTRAEELPCRT